MSVYMSLVTSISRVEMHWGEWEKLIGDQKGIRRLEELFTGRGCSPASRQTMPFYSGSLKMETLQPLLETQVIANTFNTRKFFLTTWVIIKTFNHRYSRYSMGTNQSEQILAVNNWTGHTGGSRPYATLVSFILLPWLKLKLILFFLIP